MPAKPLIPAPHSVEEPAAFNTPILSALSRALHWQRLLEECQVASGREIASREGLHPTTVNELLRLTLLSPQSVQALMAGRQPRTLSLAWLKSHELPRSSSLTVGEMLGDVLVAVNLGRIDPGVAGAGRHVQVVETNRR